MKVVFFAVLAVVCLVDHVTSAGAGRAFPIQSENYAIQLFSSINPYIEWDPQNFLVDLAGLYTNCRFVGVNDLVEVDRNTPEGSSIVAIVDDTLGDQVYAEDVDGYIRKVLDSWMINNVYRTKISEAERTGCSVRPACQGRTVVSCLFSPGGPEELKSTKNPQRPTAAPIAYAFTPEQYEAAEFITGVHWDRSHFMENLSGYETSCDMITAYKWDFPIATEEGEKRGLVLKGMHGAEVNRGETQPAMERIMMGFTQIPESSKVGCSVIPDCMYGIGDTRNMYVVVSCVYEE